MNRIAAEAVDLASEEYGLSSEVAVDATGFLAVSAPPAESRWRSMSRIERVS